MEGRGGKGWRGGEVRDGGEGRKGVGGVSGRSLSFSLFSALSPPCILYI